MLRLPIIAIERRSSFIFRKWVRQITPLKWKGNCSNHFGSAMWTSKGRWNVFECLRLPVWGILKGKMKSAWKFAFLLFCLFCFFLRTDVKTCREQNVINKKGWLGVCLWRDSIHTGEDGKSLRVAERYSRITMWQQYPRCQLLFVFLLLFFFLEGLRSLSCSRRKKMWL